jgi:hypothetical protein
MPKNAAARTRSRTCPQHANAEGRIAKEGQPQKDTKVAKMEMQERLDFFALFVALCGQ